MNSISKNFGQAAYAYDQNADIQRLCSQNLIKLLPSYLDIESFVDVGAGTGFASIELLKIYPNAKCTLIDLSAEMLEIAKSKTCNSNIIKANAETFDFENNHFDLAISNLSLQWFSDFENFLKKIMKGCKYFLFSTLTETSFLDYKKIFENKNLPSPTFGYHVENFLYNTSNRIGDVLSYTNSNYEKSFQNALEAAKYFKHIGANLSSNDLSQSKIAAVLKSHKSPLPLQYKVFSCFMERKKSK